uniref:NADH-ubiquinone oxidoreductase chain 6 n=1 Tax=Caenis sp. JYZ-2018 TaxID=2493714 RepID=A0A3S8Q032_9INSE|nr:NADH dehydrogenase subunit 6 [Caenis sp. JYZ-2018]
MMLMTSCLISLTLTSLFLFMNHPLAMGLVLLIQTLILSMSVGLLTPTFWFSYILFLVFLGGMLVLFIYVSSLASNEMFSLSTKSFVLFGSLMMMTLFIMLVADPLYSNNLSSFIELDIFTQLPNMYSMFVLKMYNTLNYTLTMVMIIYLLLALVIVANIVIINEGPLRPLT